MRVFVASLATETNTFSPIRIDRGAFEDAFYAPPGEHPETPTLCSAPFIAARRPTADMCQIDAKSVDCTVPAAALKNR